MVQNKNFAYLIILVFLVMIGVIIKEVFFRVEEPLVPDIIATTPEVDIDWSLLGDSLLVREPRFKVTFTVNPEEVLPSQAGGGEVHPVDLIAEIPGLISGSFSYKFDCEGDGTYELEVDETPSKNYVAHNLCLYPQERTYFPVLKLEGTITVYRNEEPREERVSISASSSVKVRVPNQPPEIIFCDVSAVEGVIQPDSVFMFEVEASDPDGDTLTYQWDFGDGESSSEESPMHSYKRTGFFLPRVTVTDPRGKKDTCMMAALLKWGNLIPFEELTFPESVGREHPFQPY